MAPDLAGAELQQVRIEEQQVAGEVLGLLQEGSPTPARLSRLVAVVRHQLEKAASLFDRGENEAGLATVQGALLLVRVGELRSEMFLGVAQSKALEHAAATVAKLGDEGRAEGLYSLLEKTVSVGDPVQAQTRAHLAALEAWKSQTQPSDNMLGLSERRLGAAKKLLVQPTVGNLQEAQELTHSWVKLAFSAQRKEGNPATYDEYDERREAHHALLGGSRNLAALYLRNGDASGALRALDDDLIAGISSGPFVEVLAQAADGSAHAWGELFQLYALGREQGELVDRELAFAAAWGAAVELYRNEPEQFEAALPLANLLTTHGLGSVAPMVLQASLAGSTQKKAFEAALRLTAHGIVDAERAGQLEEARQIYQKSLPIIRRAQQLGESLEPSPGQLEYLIGAMESRAAELDRARVHLRASAQLEPTRGAFRLLAAIERQRGRLAEALNSARSMKALAVSNKDLHGETRALLLEHSILVDLNNEAEAQVTLDQALRKALETREVAHTMEEVTYAESTLAEVLEAYRELAAANRAADRAHEAAVREPDQLAMTLQDASRRAIMVGDVAAGRLALRRALDGRIDSDVLLYIALWTWLVELQSSEGSDGTAMQALSTIEPRDVWAESLRKWARGEWSDVRLQAAALTPVQKVEADFYVAARPYVKSPTAEARAALETVAASEAIELVEVRVARALLKTESASSFELPKDVALP